ncbi:hypothetical protein FACS189472_14100 [Alphaproteobacteria bacterium]|nr:hypothetical protein FACS189472_14100 [Alphaproteobacteria bacterium]
MPGQYSKNNFLIRSLKRKYPYDDVELTLKKPHLAYNISTLGLPPDMISKINSPENSVVQPLKQNKFGDA